MRLAALMKLPTIFIGSHDSIAVGEDGPTHEPVEQLASFRAMPNLDVIRPADANETAAAWRMMAKTKHRPSLLVTSRQALPVLNETIEAPIERGGYILAEAKKQIPDGILLAAGSEVHLALAAKRELMKDNIDVRVVSMPCQNRFDEQPLAYREQILPSQIENRVAIEMGASQAWDKYVGLKGKILGVDRFGLSGDGTELTKAYGFTIEKIVATVRELPGMLTQGGGDVRDFDHPRYLASFI